MFFVNMCRYCFVVEKVNTLRNNVHSGTEKKQNT